MKAGRIRSNQVRGFRRIFSAPVTQDGQQFQVDLPRGPAVEAAYVVVTGTTINITTTFTSVRSAAAAKYVRRVDWVLNGNITLDSISGYGAYLADSYIRKCPSPNTNPASFNVSTPSFRSVIPLNRVDPGFVRPKDSVLKTDENVTTNQLRVQLGNLSDMFVGAGVVTYVGATVTMEVFVQDYQEAQDANGRTPIPLYYWKKTEQLLSIASIGNSIPFRINTGNRLRGILLMPQDSVNSEPSTGVVSRLRIQRSGDTRVDLSQACFQVLTLLSTINEASDIGSSSDEDSTATSAIWLDFANPVTGMNAKYSECWPVPSNSDVQLLVDTLALGSVRMITIEGVDLYPSS